MANKKSKMLVKRSRESGVEHSTVEYPEMKEKMTAEIRVSLENDASTMVSFPASSLTLEEAEKFFLLVKKAVSVAKRRTAVKAKKVMYS